MNVKFLKIILSSILITTLVFYSKVEFSNDLTPRRLLANETQYNSICAGNNRNSTNVTNQNNILDIIIIFISNFHDII